MSDYDMERRCAARYPLRLPVRYSFSHVEGWGETINISGRGALIAMPDHAAWPVHHLDEHGGA